MFGKHKVGFIPTVKCFHDNSNLTKNLRQANSCELLLGGLAQLVEHLPCKQGVSGSIPLTSTKTVYGSNGFIAQLVRAHA